KLYALYIAAYVNRSGNLCARSPAGNVYPAGKLGSANGFSDIHCTGKLGALQLPGLICRSRNLQSGYIVGYPVYCSCSLHTGEIVPYPVKRSAKLYVAHIGTVDIKHTGNFKPRYPACLSADEIQRKPTDGLDALFSQGAQARNDG